MNAPQRIVCLTAEAADWLWRLGAWDSVIGVTAYFEPSPDAAPKPRVSGFSSASVESILRLNPDLVIAFSDVQAGIVAQLILRGCNVLTTNQRTIAEIESALTLLARCVDRSEEGERLLREFRARLAPVKPLPRRPRVYFEEWNDPLISGIAWVSELIERAGGEDIFSTLRSQTRAPDRVVTSEQVLGANPEIIFASWCGKPVSIESIATRMGWSSLSAVQGRHIYELSGADILQPGFGLLRGYEEIKGRLQVVMNV
jgi:iron complex transport system substrate-binding protein